MVDLQESLALIAACLNEEARKAMFDLLSGELRERVEDLARHVDPMGEELAPYQQRLVVGFEPPVQVEDKNVVGETVEDASIAGFIAEGARDESDPLEELPKQNAISPRDAGLNQLPILSIKELALAIKKSDLLFCNHTGIMHLASAVKTPVLLL